MSTHSKKSNKKIKQKKNNRRGFLRSFTGVFTGLSFFGAVKVFGKPDKKVNNPNTPASRMSTDPLTGEVKLFAGNFAPRGWLFCHGQLLPIAHNTTLFSLLGTTYGGDGRTSFALPDLRGRIPIQQGTGPGLSSVSLGQRFGEEGTTLTSSTIPPHTHKIKCDTSNLTRNLDINPNGKVLALSRDEPIYGSAADGTMNTHMVSNNSGGQPHNNMQPSLVLNYIICLDGAYPSR